MNSSFARFLMWMVGQAAWASSQLRQLVPLLFPVAVLAHDHSDVNRATFFDVAELAASPGNAGFGALTPVGGDIEVLGAFFSGGAATNAELLIDDSLIVLGAVPSSATPCSRSQDVSPFRANLQFGLSPGAGSAELEAPANTTTWVPGVAGMILQPGITLSLRAAQLNQTFRVGFLWRNH